MTSNLIGSFKILYDAEKMASFSDLEDSEIKTNVRDSYHAFTFLFSLAYTTLFSCLGFFVCLFHFSVNMWMTFLFHAQHYVTNFVLLCNHHVKKIIKISTPKLTTSEC